MAKPNVLYIHCHDAGRAPSAAGGPIECPALSRFAREGVSYSNAFCVGPTCSPSRGALLTGRYPLDNGLIGLAHLGFRMRDYGMHAAQRLRGLGYETVLCGLQHVANPPASSVEEIGYSRVLGESGDFESPVREAALFLGEREASSPPFFLDVGFFAPHRPYPSLDVDVPDAAQALFPHLADTPEHIADKRALAASLLSFDKCVGMVLDALDAAGLSESTLVLATTDHGPPLPGMKGTLRDDGLGVFLVLRLPGAFEGGRQLADPVSHLDVMPTILDLAESPDGSLPGRSLAQDSPERPLFFETNWHAAWEPARAVRTRRWKLIRNFGLPRGRILPNIDDSPAKALLHKAGVLREPLPPCELHDLIADPMESRNLADDPRFAAERQRLERLLDDWMRERSDPLLRGEFDPPDGAVLTPWDAYTPLGEPGVVPAEARESALPE